MIENKMMKRKNRKEKPMNRTTRPGKMPNAVTENTKIIRKFFNEFSDGSPIGDDENPFLLYFIRVKKKKNQKKI